jgi:hypothetical protein
MGCRSVEKTVAAPTYDAPVLGKVPGKDEVRVVPMGSEIQNDRVVYRWQLIFGDSSPLKFFGGNRGISYLPVHNEGLPRVLNLKLVARLEHTTNLDHLFRRPGGRTSIAKAFVISETFETLPTKTPLKPWQAPKAAFEAPTLEVIPCNPTVSVKDAIRPFLTEEKVFQLPAVIHFVKLELKAKHEQLVFVPATKEAFVVSAGPDFQDHPRLKELRRLGVAYETKELGGSKSLNPWKLGWPIEKSEPQDMISPYDTRPVPTKP